MPFSVFCPLYQSYKESPCHHDGRWGEGTAGEKRLRKELTLDGSFLPANSHFPSLGYQHLGFHLGNSLAAAQEFQVEQTPPPVLEGRVGGADLGLADQCILIHSHQCIVTVIGSGSVT